MKLGVILMDKCLWIIIVELCIGGGVSYVLIDIFGSLNYIDCVFVIYSN